MKPAADMGGKQMNLSEITLVVGPQELVRLDTPQHVEFGGAFLDCGANRQPHQDQADAVRLVLLVEAVLVKVKAAAVVEAVHHRRDRAIEPKHIEPEPAFLECPPRRLVLECPERRRLKCRGASLVTPALAVEGRYLAESLPPF